MDWLQRWWKSERDGLWIFGSTFSSRMEFFFLFFSPIVKISFSIYIFFSVRKTLGKAVFFLLYIKSKRNKKIFLKLFFFFIFVYRYKRKSLYLVCNHRFYIFCSKKMLELEKQEENWIVYISMNFPQFTMYE